MIMTTEDEYNGWPNYETWNVNLWVFNDEYAYTRYRYHTIKGIEWDSLSVEQFVLSLWPYGTPDFDSNTQYDKVKWNHLAELWNADESG